MASFPQDFYATLVQAGTVATGILKLPNQVLDSVYRDYDEGLAQFGETVNIVIPTVDVSNASDIGNGAITGVAPADTVVPVVLNKKLSSNRKIPDFDTVQANPIRLATLYIAPVIEEVLQLANSGLAALFTAGNFNSYAAITGGADLLTRSNVGVAWANLRAAGVPTTDGRLNLLMAPIVYANTMASSDFANESVVGINEAEQIQQTAVFSRQFNARFRDDPHMPVTSGAYTCALVHEYAVAMRTALTAVPQGTAMVQTTVFPKPDVPVQLQLFFDPVAQAHYIHAFMLTGWAVARKTHASLLVTT